MSDSYRALLEATVQYLESLQQRGERWVGVSRETLTALASPSIRTSQPRAVTQAEPVPETLSHSAPPLPPISPVGTLPESAAAPESPEVVPAPSAKGEALARLREQTFACQKCPPLAAARKNVVFGVGDPNAALMFVGEAPGADEDAKGEPFVGAAGQLLTRIIKAMGLTRETVYIANVLKCRPDTPGQLSGNRKPASEEMSTCLPYLREQISIIKPQVLVALGATAMEGLFGKPIAITRARGRWQALGDIPVMPTYHPSYLLRNQSPKVKREVWEDMLQVLEKLGASITEKQRNYFKDSVSSTP